MRIVIDTNRYRDFCANDAEAVDRVQLAEKVFLTFVTVAELRAGFLCGTRARENERVLSRFLQDPRVEVLYSTENTSQHYAYLYFQLRKQGTPIPTNDLWIAALTVENQLLLYSRDGHFDKLPQLPRAD